MDAIFGFALRETGDIVLPRRTRAKWIFRKNLKEGLKEGPQGENSLPGFLMAFETLVLVLLEACLSPVLGFYKTSLKDTKSALKKKKATYVSGSILTLKVKFTFPVL